MAGRSYVKYNSLMLVHGNIGKSGAIIGKNWALFGRNSPR